MADEIQINANDLLAAFTAENSALLQRAVLAELRVRSLQRALKETQAELDEAKAPVPDGEGSVPNSGQPLP